MLKRVSIQNFKSLKDVTLDLQKVNLLIGPNNSGKTNFLKALEFLGRSEYNSELYKGFVYRKKNTSDSISIGFSESMEKPITDSDKYVFWMYTTLLSSNGIIESSGTLLDENFADFSPKEVVNLSFVKHLLGPITIYKTDPNKLDKPSPVGKGANSVNADASNLIAFFDRIRDEFPSVFAQIKADLVKCVPEFTEINFQSIEPTDELIEQFGDKTFKRIGLTNGKQKTIYWADELSEGTLYFIALLCIINQPNPPKLLLLEEPEKGIHPRRIFEVIQFIFRLAEEKDVQVIMTTHSPLVVDMFKDMPESVFIFDKDDEGATHVKNLQYDIIEPEIARSKELGIEPPHYTDSLGDAWTVGFLGGVPK